MLVFCCFCSAARSAGKGVHGNAMLGFFMRWSINLLALIVAGVLIPGIEIRSILTGILAAGILGIVNAVLRPIVLLLTLPINLVTLGLFTLVVNAAMLELVSAVAPGFSIGTFGAAFLGALVISIVSWMLNVFVGGNGTVVFIKREKKGHDRGR